MKMTLLFWKATCSVKQNGRQIKDKFAVNLECVRATMLESERGGKTEREKGRQRRLCTGDPYYVLYTALLIS